MRAAAGSTQERASGERFYDGQVKHQAGWANDHASLGVAQLSKVRVVPFILLQRFLRLHVGRKLTTLLRETDLALVHLFDVLLKTFS